MQKEQNMLTGLRTLVLNASYMPASVLPLESIPAEDAVTRVINGGCHVVSEYDRHILTPNLKMKWPSVIARNRPDKNITRSIKLEKETIFYRDHGICAYCEKQLTLKQVTYDHVYPQSKGGKHTWNNIVASCTLCNSRKGNKLPHGEWKPKITPYTPTYWQILSQRRKFPIIIPREEWRDFLGDWEGGIVISSETEVQP